MSNTSQVLLDHPVVFFDLDLTLLTINSATQWVKSEWRQGWISHAQLLRAAWFLTRYRLGATSLEQALCGAIQTLKGQSENDLIARVHEFYQREVRHAFRSGALHVVEAHLSAGDYCYLMTSSSCYLSELVVHQLGIQGALAQRFKVVDGIFTGEPEGGLCFGSGKLEHAHQFVSKDALKKSTFYTDSYSDLALLKAVGFPKIVHPDIKLARVARNQDWPILDW